MPMNMRQVKAIENSNKQKLLRINPKLTNNSGIYFLTRTDENGISYFYIGQSVKCLQRLCSHMVGKEQHIDRSILKRGFFSNENPFGWKVNMIEYPIDELDKWEKYWILEYTKKGYQCRYNKTAGGQGEGKEKIGDYKPSKGYRQGIVQGRKNASKEIAGWFDKYLDVVIKKPCKYADVALQKFQDFLNLHKEGDDESG